MKRRFTPRLMIIAASIAGLVACDSAKKAEQAQQNHYENAQEAAKEQAELTQEQRKEQAKLNQEHAEEKREVMKDGVEERNDMARGSDTTLGRGTDPAARDMRANREVAEERNEVANERTELTREQQKERADLTKEQAEERADLSKDHAEERTEGSRKIAEASKDADEDRAEIVKDTREKLRDLDERAAKLQAKAQEASPQEKTQVSSALSAFPTKRQALERDIEALNNVAAANLNRAKDKVEKQISSLEKSLDRAESAL